MSGKVTNNQGRQGLLSLLGIALCQICGNCNFLITGFSLHVIRILPRMLTGAHEK
jgi:hypothetical protein